MNQCWKCGNKYGVKLQLAFLGVMCVSLLKEFLVLLAWSKDQILVEHNVEYQSLEASL